MTNKWVTNKAEEAGHLLRAEVRKEGAASGFGAIVTTSTWRKGVPWLQGARRGVIFAAGETGCAVGLEEGPFSQRLERVYARAIARGSLLGAFILRGVWDKDELLQVPDEITSHVIGNFATTGLAWLWAQAGTLELWSDAYRLTRVAAGAAVFKSLLDPSGSDDAAIS